MINSSTAAEHKELGNKAFTSKKFEEAVGHYSDAIKIDATNHIFFSNRSAANFGLKKFDDAAKDAKECIRIDPSFMKGYYRLAQAQNELKAYDAAQSTIKQGLALDANNTQLLKLMRETKQNKRLAEQQKDAATSMPLPTTGKQLDSATTKELQDLQIQYSQSTREYNAVQAHMNKSLREQKMQQVTQEELGKDDSNLAMYKSVGKVFVKSSKENIMEYLETSVAEQGKKQKDMTQKLEYLEKRIKSQRQNMEELVGMGSGN
uniref:Hsp70-Hsp90 organising protein n=1 Tax=Craspedostauros australis TaxID=1486917 RepID=A0A7R9X0M1_9STRA|mmetsp:Transcript_5362/g.14498  ORF Transcript_5362/g.14498 Transcript_5362/m.14498 type:complete len:262 (+) Transcript_5362:168-953(+)